MLVFVDMDAGPSCNVKGHVTEVTKSGSKLVCVVKKSAGGFTCIGLDVDYLMGKKSKKLVAILRSERIIVGGKTETA